MMTNIRQVLFQMLVLAEYSGDKEKFIKKFLKNCQKTMLPVYASSNDYYDHLHRATLKGMNEFIQKIRPSLTSSQIRNLYLLTHSFFP